MLCDVVRVCVLFGIFTEMIKYVNRCKQINAYKCIFASSQAEAELVRIQ
jgi:hypothetical protein